ncbi:hypothetical protein POVWA1_040660 [Plasmodium ovale wallikeri]|uniref:Uncharacterized protein n=1 Tax=Plasmodium ovale wallikeri TaxID=864142 RepID=A0A1A8Z797_PLAOA|nr:hypothetical protein POVWA1_040660 [Plasmodium ovale wallikeri]
MEDGNAAPFDVSYFLKSCTDLEKSYEKLLGEKKKCECSLGEALKSAQDIKEKYQQEKKKNFEISLAISENTDELVKKQTYTEKLGKLENITSSWCTVFGVYDNVKNQNDDFRKKIDMLKREKEQEKLHAQEQIQMMESRRQQEVETYEKLMRGNKNKLMELEGLIVELDLDVAAKDVEINKLSSRIGEIQQEHEKEKQELEKKIEELIEENEKNNHKNMDYTKLEKEHLHMKQSLGKTTKKGTLLREYSIVSRYLSKEIHVSKNGKLAYLFFISNPSIVKRSNRRIYEVKKRRTGRRNIHVNDKSEDENVEPVRNTNIFRNKYNYIPSMEEVREDISIFKKEKSFYFTEHSILELINIENNIIVLNIEGKFFEDINVVFAEVTKYLLNKYLAILGVHPYNIKSLNLRSDETER